MDDLALLSELAPTAEKNLERHLAATKQWYPHKMVPWSRGRDFAEDEEWDPREADLPDAVRSALYVNLLTEDNLPYYFRDIDRMYGYADGAWGEWTRRWTAEEGRHAIVIRDYLMVTRAIDPVWLEDGRMAQVQSGQVPEPPSALHGFAYVSLQELATRISHRNTGKLLGEHDKVGYEIMARVASDENHHFIFYRDMAKAALEADPNGMMTAIADEVTGFAMPGVGIPGFNEHAKAIANAGIYDFAIHHEQILVPVVLRHWDVENVTGLDAEGEQARERLMKYIRRSEKVAARIARKREAVDAGEPEQELASA
ncbi:acyl-ACP desaturase [Actinomarinicola tropica]|uniref:Acyl-ACP desaturase n=1 Tax=Actinomarinicola tropica TaxID=2789776 RepID=A0A5Q2RDF4_9ACTN|nr:acyl-ACP desaturase [Actinomarinicola tropica]QGG93734.1 acyl-ACP desaturase [Actinomarinicola tropica]